MRNQTPQEKIKSVVKKEQLAFFKYRAKRFPELPDYLQLCPLVPNREYIASRKVTFARTASPSFPNPLERPLSSNAGGEVAELANTLNPADLLSNQHGPFSPQARTAVGSPLTPGARKGPVATLEYADTH